MDNYLDLAFITPLLDYIRKRLIELDTHPYDFFLIIVILLNLGTLRVHTPLS